MKNTNLYIAKLCCCLSWAVVVAGFCTEECKAPGIGIPESMVQKLSEAIKASECSLYDRQLWPEDYAEQFSKEYGVQEDFDFVVVGAGTAGSVVASRLSENSSIKVLVLEVGGDPPKESEMFAQSLSLLRTKYVWNDYLIPNANSCQAMIGESCYLPHGKMIGGTGGVNDNIFLSGTRENYEGWERAGNPGWSWEDANKYFSKAKEPSGNASHPLGGLTLNYFKLLPERQPLTNLIYHAAEEIGLPIVKNFDEGRDIGVSTNIWTTTRKGRRMSTGKTYLAKVGKRPNLKVIKYAHVKKVRLSPFNQAIGVDFTLQGKFNLSVNVRKEVILSAGALSSPKILMLSGIGPRKHLRSLGIPCRKHLQVGENLQDHGNMAFFFKINRGNLSTFDERAEFQNIFNYFLYSEGMLAHRYTLYGHINTDPNSSSPYPDMQLISPSIIPVGDRSLEKVLGLKRDIFQIIQSAAGEHEILLIYNMLINPQTRGCLKLGSSNAFDSPRIDLEYGKHDADKAAVVRFVHFMKRFQNTKAFKKFNLEMIHPSLPQCTGLAYDSDAYWICYARYFLLSGWHPAGTCKMGPQQDPHAVVDARLRVHGVRNLRVIDASIMPVITSANTNGPTIMIGEKGAAMVLKDWKS